MIAPHRSSGRTRREPRPFQGRAWLAALLCLLLLALWSSFAESATAVAVEQVPKPAAGSWTVDLTGTLSPAQQSEIDRVARTVQEQGRGQLVVVAIGSTGGAPHRDFATRLANAWGVGSAERDDGVLILAALDDRAVEIVLGLGLDSPAEIQVSQEIVDGEMVPRFRAGDPAGALRAGAEACARRLFRATLPEAASESRAATPVPSAPDAPPGLLTAVEALPPAETKPALRFPALMLGVTVLLIALAWRLSRRLQRGTTDFGAPGEVLRPDVQDHYAQITRNAAWGAAASASQDSSAATSSSSSSAGSSGGFDGGSSGGSGASGSW